MEGDWTGFNVIYDQKLISSSQTRDVYHFLSRCMSSKNGKSSFPTYDTISEYCNISRQTVSKALKELQTAGLLKKERRTNKNGRASNLYTLLEPPEPHVPSHEKLYQELVEQYGEEAVNDLIKTMGDN